MKMKAFEDTVRKLLRQDGWGFESTVKAIGSVAEAAGVVWDPEEEPLPEEITYSDTGRLCALNGRWLELREIREVVRRWSAVRRVRTMIAEGPSFCATVLHADELRAKILAILDGEEEGS